MTQRILILGVTGMLGNALFCELGNEDGLEVYGTTRSNRHGIDIEGVPHARELYTGVDARDLESLYFAFRECRPEVIINCIGVIKQDPKIMIAASTIEVNSLFPHLLADKCRESGARLIHVSTDCVFSGLRGDYVESDNPDPADLYGRSKLLGEIDQEGSITLRTSIIGHELSSAVSLLDWFLEQKGEVKGFTKAIFSGITTVEFASLIRNVVLPRSDLWGLFHVASTPISKFELLSIAAEEYGWTGRIVPFDEFVCDRSLNADLLFSETGYRPPDWPEMLSTLHSRRG